MNADTKINALADRLGATELTPPCLIAADTLRRAEYDKAFPQLLFGASPAADPDRDPGELFAHQNLAAPEFFLSPAACYHAYDHLQNRVLEAPQTLNLRARCFRNEDRALVPGRRQLEFDMREIVFVGAPDWIDAQIETVLPEVDQMAGDWGLETDWEGATDPFFLPRAGGKAHMQRLLGTKRELCIPDGLAVASINRHGDFFGERFGISSPDGAPLHSACLAFGIDRIEHQLKETAA